MTPEEAFDLARAGMTDREFVERLFNEFGILWTVRFPGAGPDNHLQRDRPVADLNIFDFMNPAEIAAGCKVPVEPNKYGRVPNTGVGGYSGFFISISFNEDDGSFAGISAWE